MSSNLTASASAISKSPVISELRGFLFFGAQLIHQQARTARFSFDHDELVAPTPGNQEIRASRTAYQSACSSVLSILVHGEARV
ncbi:hypothetical protein [Caballeronia sp. GAWG2-1]|uniref:hypothetical protein n=1 Tax=Caballeronia sp. GAWG2-1 TaxID=2921744 RepID=UPI0020293723|nr:hypothetical protein [Caballeronia sp. GAWG2-1]